MESRVELLKDGDNFVFNNIDKVLTLKKEFNDGKHLINCDFDNDHFRHVENAVNNFSNLVSDNSIDSTELNLPINLWELDLALSSLNTKVNKSLDNTDTHPLMLQFAGIELKKAMCSLFNASLK